MDSLLTQPIKIRNKGEKGNTLNSTETSETTYQVQLKISKTLPIGDSKKTQDFATSPLSLTVLGSVSTAFTMLRHISPTLNFSKFSSYILSNVFSVFGKLTAF